jgi:DNA-binding transcriptional LysR family regulator
MELRHLRYFVAVAEELNYRRASERLRVAQPALSSQIKDLEEEVGARLLDRDTGGVRLTDAGATFLEEARLIVAHAARAMVVAREAAQGRRGRLTVGYFAPIFMGLMPASLKAFREKFPDVEVVLVELPIADQLAALEAGTIQIAFTVGGSTPIPPSVQSMRVAQSAIRAVMRRDHRLARARQVALAELEHEQLLCFTPRKGVGSVQGEIMRRAFAARGLKIKSLRQIDGVEAFRATLESGVGVSLIAESGSLSQSENLVLRPIKEAGPDLELSLEALWREEQASQLTTNFIAVMKAVAPRKTRAAGRAG